MDYRCWRCGHGLEKTAVACPGCGEALTPVPWIGLGKRPWRTREFPDVVAIDYMRRSFLKQMIGIALIWVFLMVLGAWVVHHSGRFAARAAETHAEIRAERAAPSAGEDDRAILEVLMKREAYYLEGMSTFGWSFIGLSAVGAFLSLFTWVKVRRLLLAVPPTAGDPGPRGEP